MLITVSLFLQISVNIFNCRARSMAPYIQNERFGRKAETLIFSMCTDAGYTCHSLKSQFPTSTHRAVSGIRRAFTSARRGGRHLPLIAEKRRESSEPIE